MGKGFAVGDHVTWNSEAGYVSGKIIRVHFKDVNYKGHMRRASKDEPQYEIQSDRTDHIAMHQSAALNKTNGWEPHRSPNHLDLCGCSLDEISCFIFDPSRSAKSLHRSSA